MNIVKDYTAGDESESSDDGEPAPKTALVDTAIKKVTKTAVKKVGKTFKMARQQEEVLVYIDPPEEKRDGDTDRDSGTVVQ